MSNPSEERANRDPEYLKKIMNQEKGKHTIVKLPCGHSKELVRAQDQYIYCRCGKKFALMWQAKPKLESESGETWYLNK